MEPEIIHVHKVTEVVLNTPIQRDAIQRIVTESADIYTEEGRLLARFRKGVLPPEPCDTFYDAVYKHARFKSRNRGNASGGKPGILGNQTNSSIMSNVFGFIDGWSPKQKYVFKREGKKPALGIRECLFNEQHPEKYQQTWPLLQSIGNLYELLAPAEHHIQRNKAVQCGAFHIPQTPFTTVTTNVNFQTFVHRDSGDDPEGYGNLVVLQQGQYEGGQTCFPEYGIAIDVRPGDFLLMDVHIPHGNLPITGGGTRLSVVCYLREKVWKEARSLPPNALEEQRDILRQIRSRPKAGCP